jgi:hypothetical protein
MPDYATPEQWAQCEEWVNNPVVGATDACLLELRTRVCALEDDNWKQAESLRFCFDAVVKRIEALEANSKRTSNDRQIRSSLVEDLADLIAVQTRDHGTEDDTAARAVLNAVALWLSQHAGGTRACWLLEREAER